MSKKQPEIISEFDEFETIRDLGFKIIKKVEKAPSFEPTPEEILRIEEARKKIEEMLLTLSPREEKVVRMFIWDGLRLNEIGEKMGITEKRIKSIKATAMVKLRHPSRSRQLRDYTISGF